MDSSADGGGLRSIFCDPDNLTVYAWKNVVVFVWRGDATVELMRDLGPVFEAYSRDVTRFSVVSIVTLVNRMPDESKRQAYKAFIAAHGAKFTHVAFVLESKGFVGSAVRGLITSLLLVTGRHLTLHVMSTIEEVVAWLPARHAQSTGLHLDPADLRRVLTQARAERIGPIQTKGLAPRAL